MNATKTEAHAIAAEGIRVFPCRPNDKRPAISAWPDKATCDPGKIDILFSFEGSNLGVRCGQTAGSYDIFVVDIDVKNDMPGEQSWADFCDEHPEVREAAERTVSVSTPSGGWHFYFAVPDGEVCPRNSSPWPGVDIRGEGGYVVAPPSKLDDGDYVWVRDMWAPNEGILFAPPALLEALAEQPRSEPPTAPSVLPITELVRDANVQRETFDDNPRDWAKANFSVYDWLLRQGWKPGRRRGDEEQMTRPDKDPRDGGSATFHHDANIVNIYTTTVDPMYRHCGFHGNCLTINGFDAYMVENGFTQPAEAMSTIRKTQMPQAAPATISDRPAQAATSATGTDDTVADEHVPSLAEAIMSRIISTADLAHIPQPDPIVEGWLFRDSLAWIWGPSGSGKSFIAVDIAMHVGTGRDWHGHPVAAGRVLYMIAEGASGMSKRTDAWYEANGQAETDVQWLPTAVNMYAPESADALTQVVAWLQPDLIIIDTLARASVGAEENSAKDAGVLIDNMDRLRIASGGACVLMVHHSGKEATLGGRGSSAFKGAMESELEVTGGLTNLILKNTKQKNIEHSPNLQFFGESQLVSGSVALRRLGPEAVRHNDEVTDLDLYRCLHDIYDGTNPVSTAEWWASVQEAYGYGRSYFMRRKAEIMEAHPTWIDGSKKGKFIPVISFE